MQKPLNHGRVVEAGMQVLCRRMKDMLATMLQLYRRHWGPHLLQFDSVSSPLRPLAAAAGGYPHLRHGIVPDDRRMRIGCECTRFSVLAFAGSSERLHAEVGGRMPILVDVHGLSCITGHHAISHILQRLAHTPKDGAVAPAHKFLLFWQPGCAASTVLLCLQAEAHAVLQQVCHLMLS